MNEAEGHAICVLGEDGLSEDPFFGQNVLCVLLAGTQFNEWSHVKKLNLARLSQGEDNNRVGQSYEDDVEDADKAKQAIDGNMNTYTNTHSQSHYLAGNDDTTSTDFYVVLEAGYIVTEVKIYNRLDSFKSRFNSFKVYVSRGTDFLCEKELRQENVDESGLIQVKDIDVCIEETVDLVSSSIPEAGATSDLLRVGILLLEQTTVVRDDQEFTVPYPHMIGEFEVYGKPIVHTGDDRTSFNINVGELLPESFAQIHYIALIQDNDFDIYSGESSFSGIRFSDEGSSSGGEAFVVEQYTIAHPDPDQHSNFGSYRGRDGSIPDPGEAWTTAIDDAPERTDTWIVSGDETEDPKDFCFYTEVTTYGYNPNNPSHTNMNNFWKSLPDTKIFPGGATYFTPLDLSFYPLPSCDETNPPHVMQGPEFEFTPVRCIVHTEYSKTADEDTRIKPLLRCQGHCRHDDDCAGDLICYIRENTGEGDDVSFIFIIQILSNTYSKLN